MRQLTGCDASPDFLSKDNARADLNELEVPEWEISNTALGALLNGECVPVSLVTPSVQMWALLPQRCRFRPAAVFPEFEI